MDPDQTAPKGALIWVHTVCRNVFKINWQKTKQMTIVVIGALRVKYCIYHVYLDRQA